MKADPWFDNVLDALDAMVQRTCPSMRTLWLGATLKRRSHWLGEEATRLPPETVPRGWINLSKGSRSKYQALAMWRHAVVWKLTHVLERTGFARYEELRAIWFSRFPYDEPPFAWSQRPTEAPPTGRPADLRRKLAADACRDTVLELQAVLRGRDLEPRDEPRDYREEDLLSDATRETLKDVLKLDKALSLQNLERLWPKEVK